MDRSRSLQAFANLHSVLSGVILVVILFWDHLSSAQAAPATNSVPVAIFGFQPNSAAQQRALEMKFDAGLKSENLRAWMEELTFHPHHLGSSAGKRVADKLAGLFRAWGYQVEVEKFDVLFPTPKTRVLEMLQPQKYTAQLTERFVETNGPPLNAGEYLPSYNAYSPDGNVTSELVYVNYGMPKDYEVLDERGISVRGKIVIARYGACWRGIKPKVAAEHGAIGCILYSDPREDGYFEGDVYPDGPWRNETGVERGSVADLPVAPGDPLTPGVGATADAGRLTLKQATTLAKIPVLPISYGDALPLLKALGGPIAPEAWRGALPITYHLGAGPALVHLQVEFDWSPAPAYDVIATLRGAEHPDQWIIRGNHHDAWVCGAEDPISGVVALLEEARVIGQLAKDGWKPKRTIIFTAWDGEEPGLLGSTEWVETHASELKTHAVAYINGDNNGRGFLRAGGSHSLERFVSQITLDVLDPEKRISVEERARARAILQGNSDDRQDARNRPRLRLRPLGSGSDFTPFLQHLGISSLDLRYGGEGEGGSYHSIYDSFAHFTNYIDPKFEYGLALSKTAGRAVLRLADAEILPFEFTDFADNLDRYVREVIKLTDDLRQETKDHNRMIEEKIWRKVADPTLSLTPPKPRPTVPFLNFAPLQNSAANLSESARQLSDKLDQLFASNIAIRAEISADLDRSLFQMERVLIHEDGLPRRPWYKHTIYAPGYYTGYGVKTLPGIREAIEERHWDEASDQIEIASQILDQFAEELGRASRLVPAVH